MRTAPHTEVRADRVQEYESAHRETPEELATAIRSACATSWTACRSGTHPSHLIGCENHTRLLAEREQLPVDVARQARTATLLDVAHDHPRDGAEAGAPVARAL